MELEHVDYPHNPGTLYNCPACEGNCYCDDVGLCLHCDLIEEADEAVLSMIQEARNV
jgi:hypothetical protein